MTTDLRSVVNEYFSSWVQGDEERMNAVIADEAVFYNQPPGVTPDKKGAVEMALAFNKAFPDLDIELKTTVVEGEKVAVAFEGSGTHKGELMGIAPTNNSVTVGGIAILTIRDGKVVEDNTQFDAFGMFTQLGAIPELGSVTA